MMKQRRVTVTIDRPLGSRHPKYPHLIYPVNYGYVEGIMAPDGEEQDVYVLGVEGAVSSVCATVIAVIHRADDVEEKWVAVVDGCTYTQDEIEAAVSFQEQYFVHEIIMLKS